MRKVYWAQFVCLLMIWTGFLWFCGCQTSLWYADMHFWIEFFVGSQITWHEYFCKGYIVLIPKRYYTPYLMFNPTMSKYSFFAPRGENFDPLAQSLKVNEFHLFFGWSVFLPKIMIYVKGTLLRFRKGVTQSDL